MSNIELEINYTAKGKGFNEALEDLVNVVTSV